MIYLILFFKVPISKGLQVDDRITGKTIEIKNGLSDTLFQLELPKGFKIYEKYQELVELFQMMFPEGTIP